MYNPPLFAAPSALHTISKIMTKIFKLQDKLNIKQQDQLPKSNQKINKTLKNIYRMHLEDETLVLAFYFVDQITKKLNIFINQENSTALLIGTIILADKYLNDEPRMMRHYSIISGFCISELIQIEIEFLNLLEYNLCISDDTFYNYNQRFQQF